jgi:hypothetical protein
MHQVTINYAHAPLYRELRKRWSLYHKDFEKSKTNHIA